MQNIYSERGSCVSCPEVWCGSTLQNSLPETTRPKHVLTLWLTAEQRPPPSPPPPPFSPIECRWEQLKKVTWHFFSFSINDTGIIYPQYTARSPRTLAIKCAFGKPIHLQGNSSRGSFGGRGGGGGGVFTCGPQLLSSWRKTCCAHYNNGRPRFTPPPSHKILRGDYCSNSDDVTVYINIYIYMGDANDSCGWHVEPLSQSLKLLR